VFLKTGLNRSNNLPAIRLTLTLALALSFGLSLSAQAQMHDGMGADSAPSDPSMDSLESVWSDHEPAKASNSGKRKPAKTAKPEPKADSAKPSEKPLESESKAASDLDSAPIASSSSSSSSTSSAGRSKSTIATTSGTGYLGLASIFINGDFVKSSTWPGFGPFKSSGDNEFMDSRENKMKLHVTGDQIYAVEILVNEAPSTKQGFLNLQMVLDFVMEAVGAKPARISEVNRFIEKNKDTVIRGEIPVVTSSGDYLVSLAPTAGKNAVDIQLTAKDGTTPKLSLLPEPEKPLDTVPQWKESEPPALQPVNTTNNNAARSAKAAKKPAQTKTAKVAPTTNDATSTNTNTSTSTGTSSGDSLKKELGDVIRNWQTIKKAAVRERQTDQLTKILSGPALARQTTSIKWLADNKQYYDLTPEGVTVDKCTVLSQKPMRYSVFAKVKEHSKLMPESGSKPIDEQETTYDVNYTLERANDHWTISDSLIVKKNGDRTGQKTR
jgi:hypothetical protein